MEQQRPERYGPYAVLGQIGLGGMGTVYRALDTRLHREVALKVLHRNLDVSGARERFLHEARIVSSLSHPNICTVFDIGEQAEDLYLVMELLHGCSIKDMLAAGSADAQTIVQTALHVADALRAAHARSVVHRDIKPANLFVTEQGWSGFQVKVLDFGLAKSADAATHRKSRGITRHGATVGTIEYMSPEQACAQDLDGRSDLFSLGAVLYEMATGQVPFGGATSAVIYSHLLNDDPTPVREANLHLPQELDRILQRLLQKKPEDRYQNADELIEDLGLAAQQIGLDGIRAGAPARPFAAAPRSEANTRTETAPEPSQVALADSTLPAWPLESREWTQTFPIRSVAEASRSYPVWQPRRTGKWPIRTLLRTVLATTMFLLLGITLQAALVQQDPGTAKIDARIDTVQVVPLVNRTGIAALDSEPTRQLRTLLASRWPLVAATVEQRESNVDVLPGSHPGRSSAQPATITLSGFVATSNSGYLVHLHAGNRGTGDSVATVEEASPSLEEVPAAVSRGARELEQALADTQLQSNSSRR